MTFTGLKNGWKPTPLSEFAERSALTPEILLRGYASGIFPMSESANDPELFWVDPQYRGIFPLKGFHISRSLAKALRKKDFSVKINHDFNACLRACGNRSETWINDTLLELYNQLHEIGHAHSFEVYRGETMIGGVFGVTLGGAFFGESMFSAQTNGSKIALAYLIHHLNQQGFKLFDTQFLTDHLESLGAVEILRSDYQAKLADALREEKEFVGPISEPNI